MEAVSFLVSEWYSRFSCSFFESKTSRGRIRVRLIRDTETFKSQVNERSAKPPSFGLVWLAISPLP